MFQQVDNSGGLYSPFNIRLNGFFVPIVGFGSVGANLWEVRYQTLLDVGDYKLSASANYGGIGTEGAYSGTTFAEWEIIPELPDIALDVSAEYDGEDSESLFGTYLAGIELPNVFTVGVEQGAASKVEYTIGNQQSHVATRTDQEGREFQFTVDVGALSAESHSLVVTAFDGDQELAKFEGQIKVIDTLALDLDASASAGGAFQEIEDVRFVTSVEGDVDFNARFRAQVSDLPLEEVYKDKFNLLFKAGGTVLFAKPVSLGGGGDEFTLSTTTLEDHVAGSAVDIQVFLAAREDNDSVFNANVPEEIVVVTRPKWMDGGEAKFDAQLNAYAFDLSIPAVLNHEFPETKHTPFGLFDGLKTLMQAGLSARVVAPWSIHEDVEMEGRELAAHVKVLNEPLYDESISLHPWLETEDLVEVNRVTLEAEKLVLKTRELNLSELAGYPPDGKSVFNYSFGNNLSRSITFPLSALPGVTVEGKFGINGSLAGFVDKLYAVAGVEINLTGDPMLVPVGDNTSGTFFTVGAKARANAQFGLLAGVSVGLLGIADVDVFEIQGNARVEARIDTEFTVRFAGAALNPVVASLEGYATLDVDVDLDIELFVLETSAAKFEFDNPDFGVPTAPVTLFDFKVQRNGPDFESQSAIENSRQATLETEFGDVRATSGSRFALLGTSAGSDDGASLRFSAPIEGTVSTVGYDAKVLSSHQTLTPNQHFLETYLIGSEFLVNRVDLATLSLSDSDNPLGYSSGWTRIEGQPEQQLDAFKDYAVEHRLISNYTGTGEVVAVALDNQQFLFAQPQFSISSPSDAIEDGVLTIPPLGGGGPSATLAIENLGATTLFVPAVEVLEGEFIVVGAPDKSLGILPGLASLPFTVRPVDPRSPASGRLRIRSNDPENTVVELLLEYAGALDHQPPVANAGGPYVVNEGTPLALDGSGSFDADELNSSLTFEWDLHYDGTTFDIDATGETPTVSFADNFAARTIALRVTDSDGESDIATTTLTVNNVAPKVSTLTLSSATINEDGSVTVTGSFSDVGTADTHTVLIDWGTWEASSAAVVTETAGSGTFTATHQYLNDNPTATLSDIYKIKATLTDDDGASVTSAEASLTVNNLAPANVSFDNVTFGSPVAEPNVGGVRGQTLLFSGAFIDVGTLDTHSATVDWGDGSGTEALSLSQAAGMGTISGNHIFVASGTFAIAVSVTDDSGGTTTETFQVVVADAALLPDTCHDGQSALYIGGTTGADHIQVTPGRDTGDVDVTINGTAEGTFAPTGRIVVFGQADDDNIQISGSIANSSWLYGGKGNDRLRGGAGQDVLLGEDGDDLLLGGSGRDLLVGGQGSDRIIGNSGDDILIAGWLNFANQERSLRDIMNEWTSDGDLLTRIENLSPTLILNSTVKDADEDVDILTGSAGDDWFFLDLQIDKATDLQDEVFANDLEWIMNEL